MPITISSRSAHDATNPRERIPDITATGVNSIFPSVKVDSDMLSVSIPQGRTSPRLSSVLPPLLFGTATFNHQFNKDPYALGPNEIVHAALKSGIRAFDTSPYYGPAETILSNALQSALVTNDDELRYLRREDYYLLTKCGRVAGNEFDYSPAWIRHSVKRSLRRFKTTYLDVVYLHDVEFVSPAEVLEGVRTLRQIRDETGSLRYIGICGYPVDTLCKLAETILQETGEPLDIVQSYANFTIQNQRLLTRGLKRLTDAGVDVIPNASPLGMGLCRSQGVPLGNSEGSWHPAPDGLRSTCLKAAEWLLETHGEKLETIAVRFAIERWLCAGEQVGSSGNTPQEAVMSLRKRLDKSTSDEISTHGEQGPGTSKAKLGVSVMGVSRLSELEETMSVYKNILAATNEPGNQRRAEVEQIVDQIRRDILKQEWTDYAWESPDAEFVNTRREFGVSDAEATAETKEQEEESAHLSGRAVELADFTKVAIETSVNEKAEPFLEVMEVSVS